MSKGEFNSVTQVKGRENMADTVYFSKIEYCEVIGYGHTTSERTTSKQTTTLLLYIVSNVFYILGMAHRVHYATRIDWTPRKLHSNAVFWHSLAPE